MVSSNQMRQSGKTASQEQTQIVSEAADQPLETDIEQKRRFRSPGFHRMRVDWNDEDAIVLNRAKDMAEKRLIAEFPEAYQVLNQIYDKVRKPSLHEGEIIRDQNGFVVWERDEYGNYNEDWTNLTRSERDNLLFTLTTRIVDWEIRSQKLWGEAMFSKGMWEEKFSLGFDAPMSGTMGDREAKGRIDSAEERYFAIFLTMVSRMSDSLVKSMNVLAQRLRDSLYSGR